MKVVGSHGTLSQMLFHLFHVCRTNEFDENVEEALVVRTAAGSVLMTLARTNGQGSTHPGLPGWLWKKPRTQDTFSQIIFNYLRTYIYIYL